MSYVTMGLGIPFKKGAGDMIVMPASGVTLATPEMVATVDSDPLVATVEQNAVNATVEQNAVEATIATGAIAATLATGAIDATIECNPPANALSLPGLEFWYDFQSDKHINFGVNAFDDFVYRLLERSGKERHLYAPQNLIPENYTFVNYDKTNCVVTTGESDPDGGSRATKFACTTSNAGVNYGTSYISQAPFGSAMLRHSFWLKIVTWVADNDRKVILSDSDSLGFMQVRGTDLTPGVWNFIDESHPAVISSQAAFTNAGTGRIRPTLATSGGSNPGAVEFHVYQPHKAFFLEAPYVETGDATRDPIYGGPLWKSISGVGPAAEFTGGVNEWMEAIFAELPNPCTLLISARIDATPAASEFIFGGRDNAVESSLGYNSSDQRQANFGSQQTFGTHTFVHENIAIIVDGANSYMRVNGVDVNNPSDLGIQSPEGITLGWDKDHTAGGNFNGVIDNMLGYDRILSDDELDFLNY